MNKTKKEVINMNSDKTNMAKTSIGSVLVGAAIGAAAVTLLNKDSRKKVKDGIKSALDKGDAKMDELQEKAEKVKKDAKSKAIKELDKTQKKLAQNA